MKAKYAGKCTHCGAKYRAGTEIQKVDGYWEPVNCPDCGRHDQAIILSDLLEDRMVKHGIGLFKIGNRRGTEGTFTRGEFLEKCQKYHEIDEQETELISWFWQGSMNSDFLG